MPFEVKLQQFAGPLQLLLELIEREQLPITEVSLAQVTEDYLKHLNRQDVPTEELADFLVIATKLLLIKSRALLPTPALDDTENPNTLTAQLRLYQMFVDAAKHLEARYGEGPKMFARAKPFVVETPEFSPPPGVTDQTLREAFVQVLKRLEPFFAIRQASLERVVSVEQRMKEIRDAMLERSRLSFYDVIKDAKRKVDVVVSFLALLELVKQRTVQVAQSKSFEDIVIKHVE